MKKTFAKATLGLTSTAFGDNRRSSCSCRFLCCPARGLFFAIASANGMNPYELATNNGKQFLIRLTRGCVASKWYTLWLRLTILTVLQLMEATSDAAFGI